MIVCTGHFLLKKEAAVVLDTSARHVAFKGLGHQNEKAADLQRSRGATLVLVKITLTGVKKKWEASVKGLSRSGPGSL